MGFFSAFLLALGLAADAAAVCASRGLVARTIDNDARKRVALYFGGLQALMPLVGWALARGFGAFGATWLPLVGGILLVYVGIKMGRVSFFASYEAVEGFANRGVNPLEPSVLMPLALATSIDALAAGVVLDRFTLPAIVVASLIGLVTAVMCVGALHFGKRVGERMGPAAHLLGATILIGLGLRLLVVG